MPATTNGGPAYPGRVLERMNRPHRREPVEGIIVLVAPVMDAGFQKIPGCKVGAMIQGEEHRFQVLGLIRIEGRVQVGPAEELRLVTRKQVGLTAGTPQLEANIRPIEAMLAIRNRTIGRGMSQGNINPQPPATCTRIYRIALIKFTAPQPVPAEAQPNVPRGPHGTPAILQHSHRRIGRAHREPGTGYNFRRPQHRGRHRDFGKIVAGLRIHQRGGTDSKPRVLENPPAQRHVRLPFTEISGLDINLRFKAQRRYRHRKGHPGSLIGNPRGVNRHSGKDHRPLTQGAEGGHDPSTPENSFHQRNR